MIFRLGFDHIEDADAFHIWCEDNGLCRPIDTADRAGCPYPPNRILEARVDDDPDGFLNIWWPFVMSFGQ